MNVLILGLAAFGLYVVTRYTVDMIVGHFAARQLRDAIREMEDEDRR